MWTKDKVEKSLAEQALEEKVNPLYECLKQTYSMNCNPVYQPTLTEHGY